MPLYEVFCGATSALIVSPIMTVIDASIIKSQLKSISFKQALIDTTLDFANKRSFIRPLSIMFLVYSSTYSTANLIDYYCKKKDIHSNLPILSGTSFVNIITIAYKDKEYSRLFNTKYSVFPKSCYFLFAIRDLMTISSCFVFKNNLIQQLNKKMPHNMADFIASMTLPILAQIMSTPIHILSIDIYNNPNSKFEDRIKKIKQTYRSVCMGRVIRVLPAFCLGGFINDMLRNRNFL